MYSDDKPLWCHGEYEDIERRKYFQNLLWNQLNGAESENYGKDVDKYVKYRTSGMRAAVISCSVLIFCFFCPSLFMATSDDVTTIKDKRKEALEKLRKILYPALYEKEKNTGGEGINLGQGMLLRDGLTDGVLAFVNDAVDSGKTVIIRFKI
jgi:hypothetical protein